MSTSGAPPTAPSAPGHLPLLGHGRQLLTEPVPFMASLRDHGPVVRVGLGPRPVYFVTTVELVRRLLVDEADRFHREDIVDPVRPFAGSTVVVLSGAEHRKRRRLVAPAFHRNRIARYVPAFSRIVDEWIDRQPVGEPVDLAPRIESLSVESMLSTLFPAELVPGAGDVIRTDTPFLLNEATVRTILPERMWPLRRGAHRRFHAASARVREMLHGVVRSHREQGVDGPDLLSALVYGAGEGLSDPELVDEMVGYLMAGTETPGSMLTAALHHLVRAPRALRVVLDEVDTLPDGPLTADSARALPATRRALQETMRLWSQWVNVVTAVEPVEFAGVTVPAGAMTGFSAHMLHTDPRHFRDPDVFDPDRWLDPEASGTDPDAFLPFSLGARKCPGDLYSWSVVTVWLASVLRRRLPVAADPARPVRRMIKGVGQRPATCEVVLYPR